MKWEAVETYTPDDPDSDRRRETLEFELDDIDPKAIAVHAYCLFHGGTPQDAKAFIVSEIAKWEPVIKAANITASP